MSSATLTMIGLYNYDNTLFDNLTFPAGIDKDLAINQILMSCGEFEALGLHVADALADKGGKPHAFVGTQERRGHAAQQGGE